ncbi:hypothetical protein [Clostridium sp.]|uniref:hypothetical protein n=1 Tax=Clostridium sp. TaxID=1506 RepID=UPI003D6D1975
MISGGLTHLSVMGKMHEIGYWEGPIDENSPTNPSSLCGIAKNSLRQAIELLAKDDKKIKLQYGAFDDREYDSLAVWGDNKR